MALLIRPPVWSRAEERDAGVWVLWYFVFGSGTLCLCLVLLWRRGLVGDEMMVLAALSHCLWGCTTVSTFRRPACAGKCSPCQGGFPCARVPPRQSSGLSLRMFVGWGGGTRCASIDVCCSELWSTFAFQQISRRAAATNVTAFMHNCSSLSLPQAGQSHIWLLLAPFLSFCLLPRPFFFLSSPQSLFSLASLASAAEAVRGSVLDVLEAVGLD